MAQYHFIGIGGIGMGKLASLLLSKGVSVSGSDLTDSLMTESLRQQGAEVVIGHTAKNIGNAEYIVYSSAVQEDNPELIQAKEKQCVILRRAQLLADLMKDYWGIGVAGAHGKTTTTSMIAHLCISVDLDPTVALGGVFQGGSCQEILGKGKHFVAELDESDGSFLFFTPDITVVTNIDFEHVDYYKSWENILKSYRQFIAQIKDEGHLIICGDDQRLSALAQESGREFIAYGIEHKNDVRAQEIVFTEEGSQFDCWYKGEMLGAISITVPGLHNIKNALACIVVGLKLELSFDEIAKALGSYQGVKRRFELKGTWGDITLIDDYAHHPTEIKATLDAAKSLKPKRIVAVFQPHRFSRTKLLWDEFVQSFHGVSQLFVTDIYAASEKVLDGVTAERLCDDIADGTQCEVRYVPKDLIVKKIVENVVSGDLVLTLGAGDITKISEKIAVKFNEKFL